MTVHAYTEDTLIERPAIALLGELGWETANCFREFDQPGGSPLGRETPAEVVLASRLRPSLEKLNPDLPTEAIAKAIEELTRDRSAMSLAQANREIYRLIKDGVPVDLRGTKGNGETPRPASAKATTHKQAGNGKQRPDDEACVRVKVIDWENPGNNDFLLCSQFWVSGDMYKRRADLVGFVNGLPLVFIELKAAHKRLEDAFNKNLRDYRDTIPQLFWFNAFIILSNGSQSRIGSVTAEWDHFAEWKKINSEGEQGVVSLETMIRGTCEPARLLDIVENFVLFSESKQGVVKMVAKNHQYLGVNNAFNALRATLTPCPSPSGGGEREDGDTERHAERGDGETGRRGDGGKHGTNYRGGFYYAGLVERARELRRAQTPAEDIMWEMLRDRRFMGLKFRRQHQIGDYVTDFYCDEAKLVAELDGSVHATPRQRAKDETRDKYLTALGITVVRIQNEVVLDDPGEALERIRRALPSPSGRGIEGEGNGEGATRGRLGVFWHTQGSGKSYSMVFFAQKAMRKLPGNWTFLVVTDRQELDDQIYRNFAHCGVVTEAETQATSGAHLKQLLREDHRYIFTLIHKFHTERGEPYPKLSDRDDIIVMTDEAHRSQYDIMAMNMRNALPNAAFIGFTGTPLMAGEEKTRDVFGDYVSIYNFKQSADDRNTVPLYYENRIPELQLANEDFSQDMERLLEEAELDDEQEKKLEREFARQYHLITRDDRLEKIAEDIVSHFMARGHLGKAMVVCIDKATAVRMYDKVRKHWKDYMESVRAEVDSLTGPQKDEWARKLKFMQETDMAVVVSQSQNEMDDFRRKGLDIATHRRRMLLEDMDEKFKDANNPFRIVFVCAMWMTGFDVPCCSTIYLDKPMRNHTLMQTIARANRVFGQKRNGLIVDYVGVFRSLQKALAIYGSGSGGGVQEGDMPVLRKAELISRLRKAVEEATAFCDSLRVDFSKMVGLEALERVKFLDDAVEAILVNDETKSRYMALARQVDELFRAALPDRAANDFHQTRTLLLVLADKIRTLEPATDVSAVMERVGHLLDESVAAEGYVIPAGAEGRYVDLSQFDFDALKAKFEKGRRRVEAERLRRLLEGKVSEMVRLNKSRVNYHEKLQRMIDEYNSGSLNVETFFRNLVAFSRELAEEDQRAIKAQLTEEELALFDLLTKPDMKLNKSEEQAVKKVAKELLAALKRGTLALDWRKRQQSRAAVRLCIEETLERLPAIYVRDAYQRKCDALFQHIYDCYYGEGRGVYAVPA